MSNLKITSRAMALYGDYIQLALADARSDDPALAAWGQDRVARLVAKAESTPLPAPKRVYGSAEIPACFRRA